MTSANLDDVVKNFADDEGDEINGRAIDKALAATYPVMEKESKNLGVLITFRDSKSYAADIIAHEAFHAANIIMNGLGIEFAVDGSNEHIAYLIQWVVKCIMEVKNYKKE